MGAVWSERGCHRNPAAKKGKANSSAATKSSGAKPKGRQTAPAITPENCDPPLKGARDPRLTVAYLEKLIDESGPEGRKEIALAFGIKPADYGQGARARGALDGHEADTAIRFMIQISLGGYHEGGFGHSRSVRNMLACSTLLRFSPASSFVSRM